MPTETRERARHERERGRRRRVAAHPDEIPGQRSIFDALDEGRSRRAPPMGRHELHTETIATADVAAIADVDGHEYVLLIRRLYAPYAGCWALPGGHIDPGETELCAARRELAEETRLHLAGSSLVHVDTYDTPGRDPRGPYVTTAYAARLDHVPDVSPADDAAAARWFPVADLGLQPLAFDHARIVADAQRVLRRAEGRW